ncbi:MAG: hypothetical protein ACI88H_001628 [Cocleimonas sp.]|jgi:uncharacterized protein with ParB-like and HNH nuclease domain
MALIKRESNTITLANFWENHQLNKYNFEPGYQRDSVWSDEKQAFLIDSILKNIPMPPIFLHLIIDDETGKTSYAVIDGKQRLTSIIRFIEGEITSSSDETDSPLYVEELAGLDFKDLNRKELLEVRKAFWRYSIPIEYIDSNDSKVIDSIFDRLNRNGESLKGQELRRAGFYGTPLLNLVEKLANLPFWSTMLDHVDVKRMEDREFISEVLFYSLEKSPLKSDQTELDKLYKKYKDLDDNKEFMNFVTVTNFMEALNINYAEYRVSGVSHLYGLWGLSLYAIENKIKAENICVKLDDFYQGLRRDATECDEFLQYKKSMASGTRERPARRKRVSSLIKYLGI